MGGALRARGALWGSVQIALSPFQVGVEFCSVTTELIFKERLILKE